MNAPFEGPITILMLKQQSYLEKSPEFLMEPKQ